MHHLESKEYLGEISRIYQIHCKWRIMLELEGKSMRCQSLTCHLPPCSLDLTLRTRTMKKTASQQHIQQIQTSLKQIIQNPDIVQKGGFPSSQRRERSNSMTSNKREGENLLPSILSASLKGWRGLFPSTLRNQLLAWHGHSSSKEKEQQALLLNTSLQRRLAIIVTITCLPSMCLTKLVKREWVLVSLGSEVGGKIPGMLKKCWLSSTGA